MPLTMHPTGLGAGIDKDRPDYTVFCGGWEIGRIYQIRGGPETLRWFWSLTVTGPMTRSNKVATLEEAKAQFQNSWDAWKAWAGLEEVLPALLLSESVLRTQRALRKDLPSAGERKFFVRGCEIQGIDAQRKSDLPVHLLHPNTLIFNVIRGLLTTAKLVIKTLTSKERSPQGWRTWSEPPQLLSRPMSREP